MRSTLLLVIPTIMGCQAAFKSSQGGATAPAGMSGGTSNSLVFSDEGGLLSRLGLGTVGVALASGAIRDATTNTTTTVSGNVATTTTTQSATIDVDAARPGAQLAIDAGDSTKSFSSKGGGLAANLEIAGQTLGGDTSGFQYDMGGAIRLARQGRHHGFGVRAYIGLGYGSFDFHARQLAREDRGPPMIGDGEYKFGGLTSRIGVWAYAMPGTVATVFGTEAFVKLVANGIGPHSVAAGGRLQLSLGFIELQVMRSSTEGATRSIGLQVGLGI